MAGGQRTARWDVFLSYSRRDDAGPALVLAKALRAAGLRVFWDDAEVPPFHAISPTILTELANATVLLAYYSANYPTRRACQHELTTAFLAGQQESTPTRRVLVVNPEPGFGHIQPVQLRDVRHARAPRSQRELTELAERVAAQVADIPTPIGAVEPRVPPRWLPAPARARSRPFVGRVPQLWQLHSALHPDAARLTVAQAAPIAVVHGPAGIGKTALVTEYAHRFAAAFPGGIFWLDGKAADPETALRGQLAAMAGVLSGREVGLDRASDVLAGQLHDRQLPSLWVLDGLPPAALRPEITHRLIGPHPQARSVLTTRDPAYRDIGTAIELTGLPETDAALLFDDVDGTEDADDPSPNVLIGLLEGHPHALTLLRRQSTPPSDTAAAIRLDRPTALAALAAEYLPSGDALDLLRVIAAAQPEPLALTTLSAVLNTSSGALDHLIAGGMVTVSGGEVRASALLGHLLRGYDTEPARYLDLRTRLDERRQQLPVREAQPPTRVVSNATERSLAWKLQVELASRITIIGHGLQSGYARGALTALHGLFGFTRALLRESRPTDRSRSTVAATAMALLETHLRPLLAHWHPALLAYEETRTQPDPIAHELRWPHQNELHTALSEVAEALGAFIADLGVITGSRYGLPGAP
jgi:hypothetical protein